MALLSTDPVDLLLDSSGDLVIENGDLVLTLAGDDPGGVGQLIREAVLLVKGEWFLDLDAGVAYFERDGVDASEAILGQTFDAAKCETAFREAIAAVAGVDTVVSVSATFDDGTRLATIAWVVTTTFGNTVADSLTKGL